MPPHVIQPRRVEILLCAPQKVPHQSSEVLRKKESKLVDQGSRKEVVLNLEVPLCAPQKVPHQSSGEPAGESRLMKASTKSGSLRVTRSQTQNSRNAKLCDSSTSRKKSVASTAAKACTIVTRSKKGCKQSPSPVPESDMSESSAIGSDYEEGEFPMSCIILVKLL